MSPNRVPTGSQPSPNRVLTESYTESQPSPNRAPTESQPSPGYSEVSLSKGVPVFKLGPSALGGACVRAVVPSEAAQMVLPVRRPRWLLLAASAARLLCACVCVSAAAPHPTAADDFAITGGEGPCCTGPARRAPAVRGGALCVTPDRRRSSARPRVWSNLRIADDELWSTRAPYKLERFYLSNFI